MYIERIELTADTDPPAWCKRIENGFECTQDVEYADIHLGPGVGLKAGKFALTRVEPLADPPADGQQGGDL